MVIIVLPITPLREIVRLQRGNPHARWKQVAPSPERSLLFLRPATGATSDFTMDESIEEILSELEDLLGGLNYVVWVELTHAPEVTQDRIGQAIGVAVGSNRRTPVVRDIGVPEMLKGIEDSLRYPGDSGHGPDPANLRSPRFDELMNELLKRIGLMASAARRVVEFSIPGPNSCHAIFWEFYFAWIGPKGITVLEGGDSD